MSKRDHPYSLEETLDVLKSFSVEEFENLNEDRVVESAKMLTNALNVLNKRIEQSPLDKDLEEMIIAVRNVLGFGEEHLDPAIMRNLLRTLKIESASEDITDDGNVSVTIEWSIYGVPFTFFADLMVSNNVANGTIDLFPFMCSVVQDINSEDPFVFEALDSELQPLFDRFSHMCGLHDVDVNNWIIAVKLVGNALVHLLTTRDVEYFGKPLSETKFAQRIILAFNHVVEVYEPEEFNSNDNKEVDEDEIDAEYGDVDGEENDEENDNAE
eukprot:GDKJ01015766.1.p1 GENE.GDKJ01015766.1~~GDKJ01015766.1.p1  ORF type:complete len:270 (-),score=82.66 GDKJ01015766.1:44-853(-)